ncbi:hypothetical protein NOGI109294_00160 [Nocardiopsis gilva]
MGKHQDNADHDGHKPEREIPPERDGGSDGGQHEQGSK